MWSARLLMVVLSALPLTAAASPTFVVQGRLANLAGEGVDGQYAMSFKLFDGAATSTVLWQEVLPAVAVQAGAFSATLGKTMPLDASIVDRPEVWVEVAIGAEPPLPRQRLDSVPSAVIADRAHDVQCTACISPEETTFMASCLDGQILRKQGAAWACVDLVIPTYSGANFALSDQLCPTGQVVRGVKADGTPLCVQDKDTTYSGANFATSGQGCGVGQVVTAIGLDGSVTCAPDKDTTYSGANFALSNKACAAGQVVRAIDAQGNPVCIADANDQYTGANFALSNKACPAGQHVSGIGADGVIACTADKDTTYTGANFALSNKSCATGQVVKGIDLNGNPVCVADANDTYTGANFAVSNKSCGAGQVVKGIDASGNPVCVADANTTYGGANFALSNKACGAGEYQRGTDGNGNPLCAGLKDFVNSNCYIYFGWLDNCDSCTNAPPKYGRVSATDCAKSGTDNTCAPIVLNGLDTVQMLGVNTDGDVNGDDKFYIGFKCY